MLKRNKIKIFNTYLFFSLKYLENSIIQFLIIQLYTLTLNIDKKIIVLLLFPLNRLIENITKK
jgi:hypothetical protein